MPNIEFFTEKRFTLSSHLIEVALKNNLSLIEFLLLMYFEDTDDKTLNVAKISKVLSLKEEQVLQAVDTAVEMNKNGDWGIPVPNYTDENVSVKVVKLIQSYTGVVNKMVWRKY